MAQDIVLKNELVVTLTGVIQGGGRLPEVRRQYA